MSGVAYLTDPSSILHRPPGGHPECPERVMVIADRLLASGLLDYLTAVDAPPATREQLLRVHTPELLALLEARSPAQSYASIDPDTFMSPQTLDAALHAAGAVVRATEGVARGEFRRAFCNVRPPGHHATRDQAMGFCFLNNVAVGIRHALDEAGFERIALVDFDVHHGNGSEDVFAGDDRVLMVSTFQSQLYPYSGQIARGRNMCNVALAPYTDGQALRDAVTRHWLPRLDEFRPQLVFVSAGFDAHREDELSMLAWRDEDYAWVSRVVCEVADRHADGRIVSTLEGGYALPALARCVELHLRALLDLD